MSGRSMHLCQADQYECRCQIELVPSQTNDMVVVYLHQRIWIGRLENTLVSRNLPTAFFCDDAAWTENKENEFMLKENYVNNFPNDAYITESAVENVEWRVVFSCSHVIDIILHFHFDTVAFVVLAALEFLIAVLFHQSRQCPFLIGLPIVLLELFFKWK